MWYGHRAGVLPLSASSGILGWTPVLSPCLPSDSRHDTPPHGRHIPARISLDVGRHITALPAVLPCEKCLTGNTLGR